MCGCVVCQHYVIKSLRCRMTVLRISTSVELPSVSPGSPFFNVFYIHWRHLSHFMVLCAQVPSQGPLHSSWCSMQHKSRLRGHSTLQRDATIPRSPRTFTPAICGCVHSSFRVLRHCRAERFHNVMRPFHGLRVPSHLPSVAVCTLHFAFSDIAELSAFTT